MFIFFLIGADAEIVFVFHRLHTRVVWWSVWIFG